MFGIFGALGVAIYLGRRVVLADPVDVPAVVAAVGWVLVAVTTVIGTVADRQIGMRVRSFMPFFEDQGRIELRTTGAYAIVRHPIYATGIGFQLGVLLATGYLAIALSLAIFALGALWFTRQEERRLIELLDDPAEYERYRQRVPALLPRLRRS